LAIDLYEEVFGTFQSEAERYMVSSGPLESPPSDDHPVSARGPKQVAAQEDDHDYANIDHTADLMHQVVTEYLEAPNPDAILLLKVPQASGKTQMAVRISEELAGKNQRVGFFGPRHNFLTDIKDLTNRPELWYEWLPRYSSTNGEQLAITTLGSRSWSTVAWREQLPNIVNQNVHPGHKVVEFGYHRPTSVCGWSVLQQAQPYHTGGANVNSF